MAGQGRLTVLSRSVLSRTDLPAGPLVVALSGGADSAICAWAAVAEGRAVRAVHVHHGLPGSDGMQRAAVEVARELGIEVAVVRVDPGRSSEGRLRAARYRALVQAAAAGEWVLTGHTADDQAETVVMNLLRGAGTDGLAGIPPRRPPVARPLLSVWRSETRELAMLLGLAWRDDPANLDTSILRNRLRLSLLPEIEASYSAAFRASLVRSAALRRAESSLLDRLASRVRVEWRSGEARMARGELATSDPALAGRLVASVLARLAPGAEAGLEAIGRVLALAGGAEAHLPGGVTVRAEGPWLVLRGPGAGTEVPAPRRLPVPGSARWGPFRLDTALLDQVPVRPLSPWCLVLDLEGDPPELAVRAPLDSDRIPVAGGTKRLREALAEAGVAPSDRGRWPVVESAGGGIVWVPGVRRAPGRRPRAARYLVAVAGEESGWEASAP